MIRMLLVAGVAALAASGCINWQASYDHAARSSCLNNPDDSRRRACLQAVETNSRWRREPGRDHRQAPPI